MKIRRYRLFWFGIALLFLGVALLIFPPYGAYCESDQANNYYCAAYGVAMALGAFVEEHNGAFTALATIAVAAFTWTLWKSSEKSWIAVQRSADIAERALTELEAPFIGIKITDPGLIRKTTGIGHDFAILKFTIVNYGRTPATLIELVDKTQMVLINTGNPPEINLDFRSRNTMPRGVVAPPNDESQPFTRNLLADHMIELAADTVPLKTNAIFFYGFVRYETIFNKRYRLGFCFIFDKFGERWVLSGGGRYNYLAKEKKED